MEHKQTEATVMSVDEEQGIVEAVWAVMGNIDDVGDIIHPGAFTKTFSERGTQIKLLDNHRTDTIMSALGTVIGLREMKRAELPQSILDNHSDATGGAWGRFKFMLDTPEGVGAFKRIKGGAVNQWSFGYDAVDKDYSNKDGRTIRNLRGIRLYEVSPVLFPANEATTTTSAKSAPTEGKPYRAIRSGDKWEVYKLDSDGNPTGDSFGSHDTEDQANEQVSALYANEDKAVTRSEGDGQHPASHYLVVEDPEKPTTWHLRVRNTAGELDHRLMGAAWAALHGGYRGNVYGGPGKQDAITKLMGLYESEGLDIPKSGDQEELKSGRVLSAANAKRIRDAVNNLHQCLKEAGLMEMEIEDNDDDGPQKSTSTPTLTAMGAGSSNDDDSTRLAKTITIELEELEVL